MEWENFKEKEITITPTHKIMLFCTACHEMALQTEDGTWIETAYRRWFDMVSGFKGEGLFQVQLDNVLTYYGWKSKEDEDLAE